MILADIANGNVDAADVCFLIAFILGLAAAVLAFLGPVMVRQAPPPDHPTMVHGWPPILGWLALAVLALGFMLL